MSEQYQMPSRQLSPRCNSLHDDVGKLIKVMEIPCNSSAQQPNFSITEQKATRATQQEELYRSPFAQGEVEYHPRDGYEAF